MIPWTTLLRHAPAILAAADALATRAKTRVDGSAQAAGDRVAGLEQRAQESAQIIQDLAQQVSGLTERLELTARRSRRALTIAWTAAGLAILALVLVLLRV